MKQIVRLKRQITGLLAVLCLGCIVWYVGGMISEIIFSPRYETLEEAH